MYGGDLPTLERVTASYKGLTRAARRKDAQLTGCTWPYGRMVKVQGAAWHHYVRSAAWHHYVRSAASPALGSGCGFTCSRVGVRHSIFRVEVRHTSLGSGCGMA